MVYDEETELTKYVWNNYQHLMTEFECRVGRAILVRAKATGSSPQFAQLSIEKLGLVDDPAVNSALIDGAEAFRRRVRARLLAEHSQDMLVKRCPKCNRVVRSPRARQCFWCGWDWHSTRGG
jgi:hypothetical protein